MNLEQFKQQLPDSAKDIKLNLSSVLTEEGAAYLSQNQIYSIALASAHATKNQQLVNVILNEAGDTLSAAEIEAAKSAAAIMAMNNVYYRFVHLAEDKDYTTMPAKLRMNAIANPGVDKIDFELYSIAISALNGCGMCIQAHARTLDKAGISKTAVQSAVRIAAVVNAADTAAAF